MGAGYLRSEFSAVGVDFEGRAALFDEALGALRSIWTDPETPVGGADFRAVGPVWLQPPLQRPHPPIWIGGNGAAARRRVVEYGTGWMPVIAPAGMASSIRTAAIETVGQFDAALKRLRDQLAEFGATWAVVQVEGSSPQAAVDFLTAFGELRIGPTGDG